MANLDLNKIGNSLSVLSPVQLATQTSTPQLANSTTPKAITSQPSQPVTSTQDLTNYVNPNKDYFTNTPLQNAITNITAPKQTPTTSIGTDPNAQIAQKYKTALPVAQQSGQPPPQTSGQGSAAVNNITGGPTPPPTVNPIDTVLAEDKGYQQLLQTYKDYTNSQNQQKSLVDTYSQMVKDSGLEGINADLVNSKKILDGTEQDIRNEISAAGGFGTESQVQALASARNKVLLQNYNALLQTRDNALNQINTMIGLTSQDRQYAQQQFENQLNFQQQIQQYRDKFVQNAKDSYNSIISNAGYGALYDSVKNDPTSLSLVERTLGLQPGQLAQLSTVSSGKDNQVIQLDNGQTVLINKSTGEVVKNFGGQKPTSDSYKTDIVDINGTKTLVTYDNKGQVISQQALGAGTSGAGELQLAQSKNNIDLGQSIIDNSYLSGAVGPNALSRLSPTSFFTGGKQKVLADIEQLTSQLTLDKLIQSKAQGATFGALSEGEMEVLSGAATTISKTAVKDSNGNITGYNIGEKDFKAAVEKITNFARLDYILKGGNPTDVDVQVMPDGSYVTKNSDGTFTIIKQHANTNSRTI